MKITDGFLGPLASLGSGPRCALCGEPAWVNAEGHKPTTDKPVCTSCDALRTARVLGAPSAFTTSQKRGTR
jgi:hypothetical protein